VSAPHFTFCRTAVAQSGDSMRPDTPHLPVLLPVPGRSRDKPRSYLRRGCAGYDVGFLQAEAMLGGGFEAFDSGRRP
jgi:hypothetical protein